MRPSLCPPHLRAVTNYFDVTVAYQYEKDEAHCVVCHGEMRVEEARRFIAQPRTTPHVNSSDDPKKRVA